MDPLPNPTPAPDGTAMTGNILQQFVDQLFAKIDTALAGHPFLLMLSMQFQTIIDQYLAMFTPVLTNVQPFIDSLFSHLESWTAGLPKIHDELVIIQAWADSWFASNGGQPIDNS